VGLKYIGLVCLFYKGVGGVGFKYIGLVCLFYWRWRGAQTLILLRKNKMCRWFAVMTIFYHHLSVVPCLSTCFLKYLIGNMA